MKLLGQIIHKFVASMVKEHIVQYLSIYNPQNIPFVCVTIKYLNSLRSRCS